MIFFYFDEISKMWAWEPKMSCWVLSEVIFWPKWSFCNQALLRFFMHMKTHLSTISFYLNLQINHFFKTIRLIYLYFYRWSTDKNHKKNHFRLLNRPRLIFGYKYNLGGSAAHAVPTGLGSELEVQVIAHSQLFPAPT